MFSTAQCNLSNSEQKDYETFCYEISEISKKLIESHKQSSKSNCFSLHSSDHQNFNNCLKDRLTTIEINSKSFSSKLAFESLSYDQCLRKDPIFITPQICLKDMETRCFKHLKDFQNIY